MTVVKLYLQLRLLTIGVVNLAHAPPMTRGTWALSGGSVQPKHTPKLASDAALKPCQCLADPSRSSPGYTQQSERPLAAQSAEQVAQLCSHPDTPPCGLWVPWCTVAEPLREAPSFTPHSLTHGGTAAGPVARLVPVPRPLLDVDSHRPLPFPCPQPARPPFRDLACCPPLICTSCLTVTAAGMAAVQPPGGEGTTNTTSAPAAAVRRSAAHSQLSMAAYGTAPRTRHDAQGQGALPALPVAPIVSVVDQLTASPPAGCQRLYACRV
jgi:hypothetical protein